MRHRPKDVRIGDEIASGLALNDSQFQTWLKKQDVVKLPITIWREPRRVAAIGRHEQRLANLLKLSDNTLGISLDERLRQLCKDAERCVVWLTGKFRELVPEETESLRVFNLRSVVGVVEDDELLSASSVRGADCLAIRVMKPVHCARGPERCEKCQLAQEEPARMRLLDVCTYGDHARPTLEITRDGKKRFRPYDLLKTFANAEEAHAFARKHMITDMTD